MEENQNINNESLTSSGLKLNFHGGIYQIKLLLLVALRGLIKGDDYYITTETKEAQGLDDIIYTKFENGKKIVWYLQAKHIQFTSSSFIAKNVYNYKRYKDLYDDIIRKADATEISGIYFFTNGTFQDTNFLVKTEITNDILNFSDFFRYPSPEPIFFAVPEPSVDEISDLISYLIECFVYNSTLDYNGLFKKYFVALIYGKVLKKISGIEVELHEAFINDDECLKKPVKKMRRAFFEGFSKKANVVELYDIKFKYCVELNEMIKTMNAMTKPNPDEKEMEDELLERFTNDLVSICYQKTYGRILLDFGEKNKEYSHILLNLLLKNEYTQFRKKFPSKNGAIVKSKFDNKYSKIVKDENIKERLTQIKLRLAPEFHTFSHDELNEDEINEFVESIKQNKNIFDRRSHTANKLLGCVLVFGETEKIMKIKSSFFYCPVITHRKDLATIRQQLQNEPNLFDKRFQVLEEVSYISCFECNFKIPGLSRDAKTFHKIFQYGLNQPDVDELDEIICRDFQKYLRMSNIDIIYSYIYQKMIHWFKDRHKTLLINKQFEEFCNEGKQKMSLASFTCLSKNYFLTLKEEYPDEEHSETLNNVVFNSEKQIFWVVLSQGISSVATRYINTFERKCSQCYQPGSKLIILRFGTAWRCKDELFLAASVDESVYKCVTSNTNCNSLIIIIHDNGDVEDNVISLYSELFGKLHKNKKVVILSKSNYFKDDLRVKKVDGDSLI